MINSQKTNAIVGVSVACALIFTGIMLSCGVKVTAKARPSVAYASSIFGGGIININIEVNQSDWESLLKNAAAKQYIPADVEINGTKYEQVGVRTKGNASLSQVSASKSPQRYSFRLKFGEYVAGQTCLGLDELVLNNMISDATYMKEYMSQDLMRYIGVQAPLTNYANISVNGKGFGFYVALESYGPSYANRVNGEDTANYYNVKTMDFAGGGPGPGAGGGPGGGPPPGVPDAGEAGQNLPEAGPGLGRMPEGAGPAGQAPPGVGGGPGDMGGPGGPAGMGGKAGGTLQYTSNSINSYPAIFDNALGKVPSNEKQEVVTALKQLSTGKDLEKYFDVDQILRYFAAHTVLVSYDNYYSNMAQNYVIAQHNGKLSVLPWDYHLSFGSFQTGQASAVVNAPIDTPVTGVEMADRPLLNQLLSNPKYLAQYHTYLQDIVDGYYGGGVFSQHVSDLKAKISSHVKADPSAFYSYAKFEAGVKTLTTLCEARAKSIAGQLAGTIPATTQGQTDNNDTLIDASSIDLANLGTNGPGRLMNNTRQREN